MKIVEGWLRCGCGAKLLRVLPQTEARGLPLWCKKCRQEFIVGIRNALVCDVSAGVSVQRNKEE